MGENGNDVPVFELEGFGFEVAEIYSLIIVGVVNTLERANRLWDRLVVVEIVCDWAVWSNRRALVSM